MTIDVRFAEEQFARFNVLCFEGALPPVKIVMSNAVSFLGKLCCSGRRRLFFGYTVSDFVMRFSTRFDLPEEEWQDVVLHEMIHYHIALNGIKDTSAHGKAFRAMMNDFNSRFDRHISVSHKTVPGSVSPRLSRVRDHFVCVSTFKDGTIGVTVCSEAMWPRIHRGLPYHYRLNGRKWYRSRDVYFNRFPHSRLPRIYKVDAQELLEHLKNAASVT